MNSIFHFNPIALRKAKIVYNFGLSECNRVNMILDFLSFNPIALRKAKIVYNFGLSECNRVNKILAFLSAIGLMTENQTMSFTFLVVFHFGPLSFVDILVSIIGWSWNLLKYERYGYD